MTKIEVENHIRLAFKDVKLGNGIGLWQARAIDDYQCEEVQQQKRLKDQKSSWNLIPFEELQNYRDCLSFFDADGMRFHIPAYIIGSLHGEVEEPLFCLTHLDDYGLSQFSSLSTEQRDAISIYLRWCLKDEEFEFEHAGIRKALNDFWER